LGEAETSPAAGWYADPAGRAAYRYHDGRDWTDAVSDGHVQRRDPLPSPEAAPDGHESTREVALDLLWWHSPLLALVVEFSRADPRSTFSRTVHHFGLAMALLAGLGSAGCGLFTASCHVRSREAREARIAHLASLEVKSIAPDRSDPADVGRMVHLSGSARPQEPVTDTDVGLTAKMLVLERNVSMFQWIETCEEASDAPRRERSRRKHERSRKCRYRTGWSEVRETISEEGAREHANPEPVLTPGATRIKAPVWSIGVYRFADFRLPDPAAQQLDPLDVRPADLASLPASIRARARIDGGAIHMGDPSAPRVGDLRVRFRARAEMPDSLVAQRGGSTHTRCPTGGTSSRRAPATHSAADLVGARPPRRDAWPNHAIPVLLVAFGVFLVYWPLRDWGSAIRGPALVTGAGVLLFVPLATAAGYGSNLAHEWWALDRRAAVLAGLLAGAAAGLLPVASVLRLLMSAPRPSTGPGAS
jgi:hypothetical protein